MGLDITAYSHLSAVGKHSDVGWCEDEGHVNAYAYDSFPASFRGIPVLDTEEITGGSFLLGGCYAITEKTETHRFQAGSYLGYGEWRADLAKQFNPETKPDLPFYELIWFADNEGSIGPVAAADLLADFRRYASEYYASADEYALGKYQCWTRAFELAADGGLVAFH